MTEADFMRACGLFNLYPTKELMRSLVTRYADADGRIDFLNFVNIILDAGSYNKPRRDGAALAMFKEKLLSSDSAITQTFLR